MIGEHKAIIIGQSIMQSNTRLTAIQKTSIEHLGFVDEYEVYPHWWQWVADFICAHASKWSQAPIVDFFTGVSPLPIYLASLGAKLITVDSSSSIVKLPPSIDQTGWGFVDYNQVSDRIVSYNQDVCSFKLPDEMHLCYALGGLAFLPAQQRNSFLRAISSKLSSGGVFLAELDLVKGSTSNQIWNRFKGDPIEDQTVHGCLDSFLEEVSPWLTPKEVIVRHDTSERIGYALIRLVK